MIYHYLCHPICYMKERMTCPAKLHTFQQLPTNIDLPAQFTYPFCYTPHPLSVIASQEVQTYLKNWNVMSDELKKGKMFGVLVVQTSDGTIGYLAAFSGILAGTYHHDYFVPPIYDLLNPDGFFKDGEREITLINHRVSEMESSHVYRSLLSTYEDKKNEFEYQLDETRKSMKYAKMNREQLRNSGSLSEMELLSLIKESQFQKAEYKRLQANYETQLKHLKDEILAYENQILALKKERKEKSAILQKKLFDQFQMLNAKGETKDLNDIFAATIHQIPPAGAGECSAPKLLQYAYMHNLKPLAMAEFWWGNPTQSEIRVHGHYYPSCRHKCEPILGFMLQGLDVEPNPLLSGTQTFDKLEVVYEDEYLLIINKPSGMLSTPGKTGQISALEIAAKQFPEIEELMLVHRLDMDTSGLLILAKNKEIHSSMQSLFEKRGVKKGYVALLDGIISKEIPMRGFIKLPLRPDYENRPFQLVDELNGKPSVTRYEVLGTEIFNKGEVECMVTRVKFYPETGRTHQLRVHSAHHLGLRVPIMGDMLYGKKSNRLYLHAESLEFKHPATDAYVRIKVSADY